MNKVIKVIHPIKGKLEGDVYTPKPKKKVAAYAVGSLPAHMDFTAYIFFYGLAQSIQKQKEPILRSVLSSYQLKIIKDLHNQSY